MMRAFLIGLQFLTRISLVRQTVRAEEDFGRSVRYFPAVELTGGIHCDGFTDTFDGLFSGRCEWESE